MELLVVVAVLAILVALSLGGINKMRNSADRAVCAGNVRSLLVAWNTWSADGNQAPETEYRADYNSPTIATGFYFSNALIPEYLPRNLRCPSAPPAVRQSNIGFQYSIFRWNKHRMLNWPIPASRIAVVTEMYSLGEGFWSGAAHQTRTFNGLQWTADLILPPQQHAKGLHFGFLDGHVELVKPGVGPDGNPHFWYGPAFARNLTSGYIFDNTQVSHLQHGRTSW